MLDVRSAALVATLLLLAPAGAESQTASGTPAVRLVGLATGQTVSGALAVEARVTGSGIRRVEFAIDGRTVRTERSYRYCLAGGDSTCQKWDSRSVADGSHIIKATAYDSAGRSGSASAVVTVRNGASASPSPTPTPAPPSGGGPAVQLVGVSDGQTVSGSIAVEARVTGSGISRVDFAIDGTLVRREQIPRYCLAGGDSTCQKWDSRSVADGSHIIKATAYDSAGRSGSASAVVTVRNGASASPSPMPTPTPTPTPEPSVPIGRVSLSWTPGEGGDPAASFRVYVAPLGGAFEPRASTSDTSVPLSGLGLTVGAIYSARVTAVSASGVESAPSSEVTFRYQP